jgi:hypothetical protein
MTLHVYTNCTEWIVAESLKEARELYREYAIIGSGACEDELDLDFAQEPDDKLISISNDDSTATRLTCDAWCQVNGKGFLATSEY